MKGWKKCPTRRQLNRIKGYNPSNVWLKWELQNFSAKHIYGKSFNSLNEEQQKNVIRKIKEVM